MKTYICTCGTSIITKRGINLERIQHQPLSAWDENINDIENFKDTTREALEKMRFPKDLDDTSAEIKSLVKMGVAADDKVILIASDTVDGKLCAILVKDFLIRKAICLNIDIKVIDGLQSKDGKSFQNIGLKNLLNFLVNLEHGDFILNPTGGFKSVVPYLSLIGMLFNKPVQYIHEDSNDVITLANVPVLMNEAIIHKVEDKLRIIEKESAISKEDWQAGIDYNDRRFDSLIEENAGQITMSSIGLLFWERFKRDYPEELIRDNTDPYLKYNKLNEQGVAHHGVEKNKPLAAKLLLSPYVKSIPNSCNHKSKSKLWIRALTTEEAQNHLQRRSEAVCIVTNIKSDAGYSFLIETTARNHDENTKIAEILQRKLIG